MNQCCDDWIQNLQPDSDKSLTTKEIYSCPDCKTKYLITFKYIEKDGKRDLIVFETELEENS